MATWGAEEVEGAQCEGVGGQLRWLLPRAEGERVQDKCERLKEQGLVDHCSIVSQRTGESGKVIICKGWDVKVIFDNKAICMEAKAAGMEVYQITKNPKFGWPTLDLAVDAFLAKYGY